MQKEEMNCKERLYAAIEQKPVDRVPCPAILQAGTVDLMDACGAAWPEAHWDAEKMAKLAWAAYEVAGLEGIRIPMTVYEISEALGCQLNKWRKDNQPVVKDRKEYAVKTVEDIDKIEVPDPKRDGKLLPATVKAIEIASKKCEKEKVPLIAQNFAPFMLGMDTGTMDFMKSMMLVRTNMDDLKKLLKKTKEIHLAVTEAYIDAGADIILCNNGVAPELGPKTYSELGFQYDKECVKKDLEKAGYVILHTCSGKTKTMFDVFCDLGVQAISFAEMIPVKEAREKVEDKVSLAGGVNQLTTLIRGSPEKVIEESKKAIEDGIDILAPGCGFGPKTPLSNMKAMVEAVKKYGMKGRLARGG